MVSRYNPGSHGQRERGVVSNKGLDRRGGVIFSFKHLPIGQYVPGASFLHRLDPRSKILFACVYLLMIFITDSMAVLGVLGLALLIAIRLSELPIMYLWKGIKSVLLLVLIIALGQWMISLEGGELYSEGIRKALLTVFRFIFFILMSSLLTLTTSPNDLTDGLERLSGPLDRMGISSHDFAFMITISLRYFPILIEETDQLLKARISRGADLDSGNLFKRIKVLFSLCVPLFISLIRRADHMALALECRCYNGRGRRQMQRRRFGWRDVMLAGVALFLIMTTFILG